MDSTVLQVLVVDDDPGMRSGVSRALAHFKAAVPEVDGKIRFEVEQAASGHEALEKFQRLHPQLVFLDFKLPDITGFDVLDQLSPQIADSLIIMMTAYASIETAVRATKHGAYDFLAKPFTPDELRTTARKAAEQVLFKIKAKKLAEEKRKLRFEFISVLSHELKAPLAAIEGYLNVAKAQSLGASIDAYTPVFDRCVFRIEQMRKLIFDLLDLTRIESGQKIRHLQETDLVPIVQRVLETVAAEANQRGIELRFDAQNAVPYYADPAEMEMIFNNLVSNAVKYNREGGQVEIQLSVTPEALCIRVSDTGIGLTEQEASRLFQDFVRIRNAKTQDILGSGLGLSTVKKLVQLYRGEIHVKSTPDVGSTFTISLPPSSPPPIAENGESERR
ncbi:MAG: hybrid sensor histidine kinase/response regulator [bacterium]|jgi:signal transduction histidine kinase|nr:hybrid sensor histidine kinase/response regulator [bacterium]